jgi:SAM-dependent methyltransferase
MTNLRIDLGCGAKKKEGTIGIDAVAGEGVDHVLDVLTQPLPFADRTVSYVHSSHFLEHIAEPSALHAEITRVCADGARLEFWTPYAWENSAFILGHRLFYNEDHYLHYCVWFVDFWEKIFKARWLLHEINYVVEAAVLVDLHKRKIPLETGIRYHKGVVKEFGVFLEVRRDSPPPIVAPKRSFSLKRDGERHALATIDYSSTAAGPNDLNAALAWHLRS